MTFRSVTREPRANRSNANDEMSISDFLSSSSWVRSSEAAGACMNPCAQDTTSRRPLHEAVPAEPCSAPEAVDLGDWTKDRLVVWSGLVKARPGRLHAGAR